MAQSFLKRRDRLSIVKRFFNVSSTLLGRPATSVNSAHTAAVLRYRPKRLKLDRVLLIVSAEGPDRKGILRHWPTLISGELTIIQTPGDHVTAMREPYVISLARDIDHWLG